MIEALWYGIVAALCFIGFVALVYYIVLSIYRPKKNGEYILTIPTNADRNEIRNCIYGAHLRNMMFADSMSESIIVLDNGLSMKQLDEIAFSQSDCGSVRVLKDYELIEYLKEKAYDGRKSCRDKGQC